MSTSTPQPPPPSTEREGFHVTVWNLLLLVPFLMLVTPWFNAVEPRLLGMPFLYWSQFAWVPIGVGCVALVFFGTRDERNPVAPGAPDDVDALDEGTVR